MKKKSFPNSDTLDYTFARGDPFATKTGLVLLPNYEVHKPFKTNITYITNTKTIDYDNN